MGFEAPFCLTADLGVLPWCLLRVRRAGSLCRCSKPKTSKSDCLRRSTRSKLGSLARCSNSRVAERHRLSTMDLTVHYHQEPSHTSFSFSPAARVQCGEEEQHGRCGKPRPLRGNSTRTSFFSRTRWSSMRFVLI